MNRLELLAPLKEGQVQSQTVEHDQRFIKRQLRNLEDAYEDAENKLKDRMKIDTPIDASIVEVLYKELSSLKAKINLYEDFQTKFYK